MNIRNILLLICISIAYHPLSAQMTDLSYPRTLVDAAAIPEIQNTLSSPLKMELYTLISSKAAKAIPEGNTLIEDRRSRSQIAREAAFVILMNKKIENGAIVELLAEERMALVEKVLQLLENLNSEVSFEQGWLFFDKWQFRCRELTHYLIAYDLLKGANIPGVNTDLAAANLQEFAGNLHARLVDTYINPITGIKHLEFFFYNTNNHGVMNAGAVGLAGIVLNGMESDDPNYQPANWINTAMWNLDYVLWSAGGLLPRVAEKDILAGYAEGPSYFNYGFDTVFPFFRALWNVMPDGTYDFTFKGEVKSIRHPWYDENYHRLYEWMVKLRMPNGAYPAVHDTPSAFKTDCVALSGIPSLNHYYPDSDFNSIWERAQFICTNIPFSDQTAPLFQPLPDAGSLIFRSTWNDPTGVYMHLIGKNNIPLYGAKAHHQADATSFEIYYHDEILAFDEGYTGSASRNYVNQASDHNLILVNGKGPRPPVSEWIDGQNTVFIEEYFDTDRLDYGELNTTWEGAEITRKVLFQNDRYFVMADFVQSSTINNYQYQFHGNGLVGAAANSQQGSFILDESELGCLVSRNGVHLRTKVMARGNQQVYSVTTDTLSNGTTDKVHSKMLVHHNEVSNTEFLSIFYPFTFTEGEPVIEPLLVDHTTSAFKLYLSSEKHLVFIQQNPTLKSITAELGIGTAVHGNGSINFIAVNNDQSFNRLFIEEGDVLLLGDRAIVLAETKMDIAYEKIEEGYYKGYVSKAGAVQFYADSSLVALSGDIESITYDPAQQLNTVSFLNATNFELIYGEDLSTSTKNLDQKSKIVVYPNPTKGASQIIMNENDSKVSFQVFDVTGKVIIQKTIDQITKGQSIPLDLSPFPVGVYLIKMEGKAYHETQRLIKN